MFLAANERGHIVLYVGIVVKVWKILLGVKCCFTIFTAHYLREVISFVGICCLWVPKIFTLVFEVFGVISNYLLFTGNFFVSIILLAFIVASCSVWQHH